jgi:hypothetical protein
MKSTPLNSYTQARRILIAVLIASAGSTDAATVLSFGTDTGYVTADTTAARSTTVVTDGLPNATITRVLSFDDVTAWNPGAPYAGPSVYGGFSSSVANNGTGTAFTTSNWSLGRNQIRNDQTIATITSDAITIQGGNSANHDSDTLSFQAFFVLKTGDFTSDTYSADGLTAAWSAGLNAGRTTGYAAVARFGVKVGGQYYLSNSTSTNQASQFTINPTTTTWAPYDPETSLNFNAAGATYSSISMTAVEAIGLYVEDDSYTISAGVATNGYSFALAKLEGTGTVTAVPEPSAYAALLGAGVMALAALRKRRAV